MRPNIKNSIIPFLTAFAAVLFLAFQQPQNSSDDSAPFIGIDSFYIKTAAFAASNDWIAYEKLLLRSEIEAAAQQNKALMAAVYLRKAEFEFKKNPMDGSFAKLNYEKSLLEFSTNDSALWQQDAAHFGLAQIYYQQANQKKADSLISLIIDEKRKFKSPFTANAIFLKASTLNYTKDKVVLIELAQTLKKNPKAEKEFGLLLKAAELLAANNFVQAELLLNQIYVGFDNKIQDLCRKYLSKLYLELAEQQKEKEKIKISIQKAISLVNPAATQDLNQLNPEMFLPDIISLKALLALSDYYEKSDSNLNAAKSSAETAAAVAAILQNHIYGRPVLEIWNRYSSKINNRILNYAVEKHLSEKNNDALQDIFFISERMKAQEIWVLLKSFENNEKGDSLQLLEQYLALGQHFWTFRANQLKAESDSIFLPATEKRLAEIVKAREVLHNNLNKTQKKYLLNKFGSPIPKLKELQTDLDADMIILSYFSTQKSLYLLSISKEKASLKTIGEIQPEKFLKLIESKGPALEFAQVSNGLYSALLGSAIKGEHLRLMIIPTGALKSLPFDLLCTEMPNKDVQYRKLPYLFKKHRLNYQLSVSDWYRFSKEYISPSSYYMLSMSPSTDSLHSLYSDYFTKRFSANVFKGAAAKKSVFFEQAGKYGFIHLSNYLQENQLEFANNEKMFFSELEQLKLNAALILLPHVSSVDGRNLELFFHKNGAASLLSALWNEKNEGHSLEMINFFYEYLQQGLSKDEALRRAKIDFLEKMPEDLHPYYWGQYRQIGDFRNVSISEPISHIWWYLLPIAGLLGIGWWAMGAMRQKSR
jgi:hypothetical protein